MVEISVSIAGQRLPYISEILHVRNVICVLYTIPAIVYEIFLPPPQALLIKAVIGAGVNLGMRGRFKHLRERQRPLLLLLKAPVEEVGNIWYIGKRVHGHADTDTDTYGKDGQLWKRRAVMEKTGSYGKDGRLWKRRTLMEKTDTYGKDGQLWKRRTVMEKTDSYGKDGQLWKRRTLMEKTDTYGKDGQLWKRRTLMEKTDTYGKDGHLWKRRTLMEKTDTKHLKPIF